MEAGLTPGAESLVMNRLLGHELPITQVFRITPVLRKSNAGTVSESGM